MNDEIQLAPLDGHTGRGPQTGFPHPTDAADLERLNDVGLGLTVEVGRTRMTLGQALALGPGSVITLDRLADQPVDLLVNGMPVARGEVVVIDDVFGLRVTQIVASVEATAGQAKAQVDAAQQQARELAA
ncbi:MAG TPA: flagellar motor switch protein FliN [Solirubrobacteraceae bacterium]|jgi:flagellar motor switch protein FliN/FliY